MAEYNRNWGTQTVTYEFASTLNAQQLIDFNAANQTQMSDFFNQNGGISFFIVGASDLQSENWLRLEQEFYVNLPIFGKAFDSTGNGFPLLAKVFSDGKSTGASENALALAMSIVMPAMVVPYTPEEVAWINQKFLEYGFSVQI